MGEAETQSSDRHQRRWGGGAVIIHSVYCAQGIYHRGDSEQRRGHVGEIDFFPSHEPKHDTLLRPGFKETRGQ